MEVKVKKLPTPAGRKWDTYVVVLDGKEVGLLEKWKNTRTESHPWKAFVGIGMECAFVKAFYPEDGGKVAAIRAVVQAAASSPGDGK